jgi:hypothetical protein
MGLSPSLLSHLFVLSSHKNTKHLCLSQKKKNLPSLIVMLINRLQIYKNQNYCSILIETKFEPKNHHVQNCLNHILLLVAVFLLNLFFLSKKSRL